MGTIPCRAVYAALIPGGGGRGRSAASRPRLGPAIAQTSIGTGEAARRRGGEPGRRPPGGPRGAARVRGGGLRMPARRAGRRRGDAAPPHHDSKVSPQWRGSGGEETGVGRRALWARVLLVPGPSFAQRTIGWGHVPAWAPQPRGRSQ